MSAENSVHLIGRATDDAKVTYTKNQKGENLAIARFTIAVNKRIGGENTADFINCIAFGNKGSFCEKYVRKGVKFNIQGTWSTGSYTDSKGNKRYTNECNIDDISFAESKSSGQQNTAKADDGFSNDFDLDIGDEDLPFGPITR